MTGSCLLDVSICDVCVCRCLSTWLGSHKWDVISFNFGLHDLAQDAEFLSVANYTEYIKNITVRLMATKAKILWVDTTPVPTDANLEPKRSPQDVVKYAVVC